MSLDAVVSRVAQLQSLMGPTPQPQATNANFAATLASASTPAATDATSAVGATLASASTPATGASSLPPGTPYGAEITAAAQRNGLDPALLAGLIKQESGFNPNAGSSAGAQGLTQLMPGTARGLGVTNLHDPVQSIEGGARYLAQQLKTFNGDVARGLAAYNAGPGAVQRYGGVPPYAETQNYVRAVQANAASFRSGASTITPSATGGLNYSTN
jgi:soluble lytic murein transglycosylase-like protein